MITRCCIVLLFAALACKQQPGSEGPESYQQFSEAFPSITLPFSVSDTTMAELSGSATIAREVFTRLVHDSVMRNIFAKDTSYVIHPVGKLEEDEAEDYFAVYAKGKRKETVVLLVFKDHQLSAAMPMLETNKDSRFRSAAINKKLSIEIHSEWAQGTETMYRRTIYAYNTAGAFTTVLTETNIPPVLTAATVINPIDTFPRKNKYSGDYVKGKKSLISVRDGKNSNEYEFFVHFVNEGDDACGGDLRGILTMTSATTGVYSSAGDPCVIDFTFTLKNIKVKEQGSCGNYRGITCFFDATYTKKASK